MRPARKTDPISVRYLVGAAIFAILGMMVLHAGTAHAQPAQQPAESSHDLVLQLSGWKPTSRLQAPGLAEISGITPSRKHPGVYWVHGDSGTPARLYAVRADGEIVTQMDVHGATNVDWEDITIDSDGRLYIGDIGDNVGRRAQLRIYRVAEPDKLDQQVTRSPQVTAFEVRLPGEPENCEALFWWQGDLYLIAKEHARKSPLYRLEPAGEGAFRAIPVGRLAFAPITSADASADGGRLVICGYGQIVVITLGDSIDDIENAKHRRTRMPPWLQIEACCFDGDDIIVTAEDGNLWRVKPEDSTDEGMPDGSP